MNDKAATERRSMDTHDLYCQLAAFVRDNQSHHHVERRWLATQAAVLREIAERLKAGGAEEMDQASQHSLREFRLAEIAAAKEHLSREAAALDQEARKLQQPKTQAA